ncbi:P-loop containing nucleoside triphosphate hydrolase protein [Mycena crocata]|nr:P-loop containing nucleoside triphosphate hydrolase protein [Mycena crocata]
MELYSQDTSWLPVPFLFEQATSASSYGGADAYTRTLDGPGYLEQSNLFTGAFLLAFTVLLSRIVINWKAPQCLPKKLDYLMSLKALFGTVYLAGAITMLVLDRSESVLSSVGVATAIAFIGASVSEHYHSIAPSTVTALYTIFGAALYGYTLLGLDKIQHTQMQLNADRVTIFSLLVLVVLESTSKRSLLIPTDPPPAYESTLSLLVKPFFPHLVPILVVGSRRRLVLPELRDIPLFLRSDPATEKLLAALAVEDETGDRYLARSTFRAFNGHFLSPVLPRLFVLAGTFAQVTLVEQLVLFVSDKSIPAERGNILIVSFFIVYVSLAISNYAFQEKINAFMVLYRSALTGALYSKTLRLTSMAARELGQGAATTYMSVDVGNVTNGFQVGHDLWAAVVSIVVACTMLWIKAGWVMFAPLLYIITLILATSRISRLVGSAQTAWLTAIDARIKLLTSVLGQLLPIKLGAYEVPLTEKINSLRARETNALGRFLYFVLGAATLSNIGSTASFFITLAAYAGMLAKGWGDLPPLDVSRVFTLFTIVNLLSGPLNMIGQTVPQLFASLASLGRIQGFLQLPEKPEGEAYPAVDTTNLVDASDGTTETLDVEVSLKGCTFAWDEKAHTLEDITLELVPCSLHMVVGSVASGKSSLLMSILEETRLVQGTLRVKAHKIAFAGQTAFIYPGTLRASYVYQHPALAMSVLNDLIDILLDNTFDKEFYDQVIHACGLQDIETLPHRDMTKLGDKGMELRFRVDNGRDWQALARAVYARADLVLLDDVFSALDGETEAHVFASLFGPEGMLKGKTTVLVTHGIHHLPRADKVLVMDAGKITHFGSFEEVRDAGATFALASVGGDTNAGADQVIAEQKATEVTIVDEEEDEELKRTNKQASQLSAYTFYLKCTGVLHVCGFFALIVVWNGVTIFSTAYLSMLASSSGKHLALWVAGYGSIVATILILMALTLAYFSYILSSFTAPHIHRVELAGVMRSPVSWIMKNPAGKVLNRFSQDIQIADQEFPLSFLNFSINVLSITGTFVFIAIATPSLAFAIPFLFVGGTYFLGFYLATSKQFRRLELGSKSPLFTLFGTTVSGLITVRAYRAQVFFREQNAAFVDESQGAFHHRLGGQLFLRVFLLWFQTVLACSVATLTVWLRDVTSAAFLGVALARLVSLGFSLNYLLSAFASVENGTVAIDRIKEFAKLPQEEKNEVTVNDHSAWPASGELTFADFSMKYRDDLPLALANISFNLQGGQKIGICGRTGSGKSSTVLALFRGIDQHLVTGKIIIDGVDISTVPLKHLRESMSIVTQDPFLWHGSVRENLDLSNERTDSEVWETLKLVDMYDTVSALDDKLDHLVVDEESFSKGQRQLLMDHITDEKIRHVVDTQMQGLTVLAVAHPTIVNYDKILVLDSGSIAEVDSPSTLLANPESRFARLAATQGIYHRDLVPNGAAVKEFSDGMVMAVTEDLVDV